jgi:hypothetical protein
MANTLKPFEKMSILGLISEKLNEISSRQHKDVDCDEWKHYSDIALKIMEMK